MWIFNVSLSQWSQITTIGDIPSARSNSTLHYDASRKRLILFGGSEDCDREKFNGIHVLDWEANSWRELELPALSRLPPKRTDHTSQFVKDYLIVFGGEGYLELDDLWIFDFNRESWTEVKCSSSEKPSPRRFHSSAVVNNRMYVIGGCYEKKIVQDPVYSLDLSQFLLTQDYDSLKWRKEQFNDISLLSRYDHSSTEYEGKIYVFAGRRKND